MEGALPMYVVMRALFRLATPTIIVPKILKDHVESLFEAHRAMSHSELRHTLVCLDVGEEFSLKKDFIVRAFRTYHVIPSQGYLVYSVKERVKPEYVRYRGDEMKNLKLSGVELCFIDRPQLHIDLIAFTGDTTSEFILDSDNLDVLKAKILIMESTYIEDSNTVEAARKYGHTHLSEIIEYADRFKNKAILLIHFSARYNLDVIKTAVARLPPPLSGRVFALTEGFKANP
ncbi:hypothetical protein ACJIZ3_008112 [Penstemon smallii]|uniref:Uncharacterized protein n=1 Tax=Penstemon smallii TaxID=265156 RepID=A0ABD3T8U2_9LAMI